MPTTIERPIARTGRRYGRNLVAAIGMALGVAALVPLASVLEDDGRADVVVVNDSAWDLGIELRRPGGATLHVAHVRAGTTRVIEEVLRPAGELEVTWTHQGRPVATTAAPVGVDILPPTTLQP